MKKFVIDYTYGVANFFTEEADRKKAMYLFYRCASSCFGIRKSLGDRKITEEYSDVLLPLNLQDKGGNAALLFGGDVYLFDMNHETYSGEPWKLCNAHDEWCSCHERGKEELACSVHHFWVENHSDICECAK